MKIEEENRERDATIENAAYFLRKSRECFGEGDIVVTTDEEENFAEYTFDLCETHVVSLNALLRVPDFTSNNHEFCVDDTCREGKFHLVSKYKVAEMMKKANGMPELQF